jgi:hypothetical protein
MKNQSRVYLFCSQVVEFIYLCNRPLFKQKKAITCFFKELKVATYNLCTGFSQNLWKTSHNHTLLRLCSIFLCCIFVSSCSWFKSSTKAAPPASETTASEQKPKQEADSKDSKDSKEKLKESASKRKKIALDNALIDKGEEDVRKRFGEPDIVSKTPENKIMWTYKPRWHIMPDNADIVYVEFEDGKVAKIIRTTK